MEWTGGDRLTLTTEWALGTEGGKLAASLTTPFHGYKMQTMAALYVLKENSTDARVSTTQCSPSLKRAFLSGLS